MKDKKKIYIAVIILIIILLACLVYFVFFNNKKTNMVNVSVDSNGMTVSKDVVLKAMWIDNDADFVTVTFSSSQGESTKIKFVKGSTL